MWDERMHVGCTHTRGMKACKWDGPIWKLTLRALVGDQKQNAGTRRCSFSATFMMSVVAAYALLLQHMHFKLRINGSASAKAPCRTSTTSPSRTPL
jgi:hypothetical protein